MTKPAQHFSLVARMPLAFGVSSVFLSSVYILQRSTHLGPRSFERFVQHHLDGIGITAFALAGTGVAFGLYLLRFRAKTPLLVWGTVISVIGALAHLLMPL